MKRIFWIGVLLLMAGSLAWMGVLFYPKTVDFEAQGMKVRLGLPGAAEERALTVSIKGKIYRENFRGDRRFRGTVELEGEEMPIPAAYRVIESVKPRGSDSYWIMYDYVDSSGRPGQHMLGFLFMIDDFSRVALAMYDHEEDRRGWTGDSGLMVAAPASNREAAVALSNELMRSYLGGYVLE